MGMEVLLIALAIVIMVLFIPVAIGVSIKILATDWYLENRRNLLIGLAVLELILFTFLFVVLFGLAI